MPAAQQSSPAMKWWIAGAYVCWIAYAGLHVALPNLMLGLSRPGESAEYAASWFPWTNPAYSLSVLAGGWILDWLGARWTPIEWLGIRIDHFTLIFAASSLALVAGIWPARRISRARRVRAPHGPLKYVRRLFILGVCSQLVALWLNTPKMQHQRSSQGDHAAGGSSCSRTDCRDASRQC
jgi:hypothetical protein